MERSFTCTPDYPVVQTKAGKLRGYETDGTFVFHGIKYADAERFQMPAEVQPWEGIKDAMSYGFVCPLMRQEIPNGEVMVPHRYWPQDENCQFLNIWTPSIDANAKKPVMVWLHGGGFEAGSSIEQVAYDGENMSKYGDVVVVSINHRLNVLGYLDLSPFGEKYAQSANVGTADMVAALQWIQENIAGFGGDPENVTLFGQSGGGSKVWTLLQTPAADGLFHKGIIESGVYDLGACDVEDDGTKIIGAMLEKLGLREDEVEKLETIPYQQLVDAYQSCVGAVAAAGGYVGCKPHKNSYYFGDPRKVGFRQETRQIPILIGTVMGEFAFGPGFPDKYQMPREAALEIVKGKYKEVSEELMELYEKAYPDKAPVDLLFLDTIFRGPTIDLIAERTKDPQSRTYSYLFTYEFPVDGGKIAWHCSEIPFVFHNIDKVPVCNRPGAEAMQEKIFGAWIQFAKTGAPKIEGVEWPLSVAGDEATMILDDICEVRHNHDHVLSKMCMEHAPAFSFEPEGIQH